MIKDRAVSQFLQMCSCLLKNSINSFFIKKQCIIADTCRTDKYTHMIMGSCLSTTVKAELRDKQESQSTMKTDMLSGQVELVRRMAERQIAMQVATVREMIVWFVPFTISSYGFLYYGHIKTNSWVVMFPLIPITFGLGYQLHYAYGNKIHQIKELAENIMANETHMMMVPEWTTGVSEGHNSSVKAVTDVPHSLKNVTFTPPSITTHSAGVVFKPMVTSSNPP
nr:uncharacterized protein LOC128693218 [Cherax quadricarinatus]